MRTTPQGNPFIAGARAELRRHGVLPPLLFVGGSSEAHETAALAVLAPLGYGLDDMLIIDLSEPDSGSPDPDDSPPDVSLAERIRRHPGPIFFRHLDKAHPAQVTACLDPDVLGPLCRPVFASSEVPLAALPHDRYPPSPMALVPAGTSYPA